MKARIAKPTNDLTEEKVQKFIDEGRDLAWFMTEYGLSVDSLGRLFYKRFGDILGTKFYNQLAANGFKKDEENMRRKATGTRPFAVSSPSPLANPELDNTATIITAQLRSRNDPSKAYTASSVVAGKSFDQMTSQEKIDCIIDLISDKLSDQVMKQYIENPEGIDLSIADDSFCQAVLSRIREQQLKRELQELFDKDDDALRAIEEKIEEKTIERERVASELSSIAIALRQYEATSTNLESRIERCRENHDWRLPQRIGELRRKATEAYNKIGECSGKNRINKEKKYNSLLEEIDDCEAEIAASADKLVRLQQELDTIAYRSAELGETVNELRVKLRDIDTELKSLGEQKKDILKACFYLKMYDEGVIVTTRHATKDLVSDDWRPMTNTEVTGSICLTDKLRNYIENSGNELSDYDIVALVRILYLAPRQKHGYRIVYGEGTEYLADVIKIFLG